MKKHRVLPRLWLLLVSLYLVVPLVLTGIYSFFGSWTEVLPTGFTTKYYALLFANAEFWPSVAKALIICVPSILVACVVVIMALYTALIYAPRLEKYIQIFCMIPQTIQGVILAVSVLTLYAGSGTILANRVVMLAAVYSIMILPYVFNAIRNSMYAVNIRQLIEAAEILGAGKFYSFVRVVVPCMKSGVMVASLISMAVIFGDFAVIKIVAGGQWKTAMMVLYGARTQSGQVTSSIIMVLFLIMLVISAVALSLQNKDKMQQTVVEKE